MNGRPVSYHTVKEGFWYKQVPENCPERLSIMLGQTGRHGRGQPAIEKHALVNSLNSYVKVRNSRS